MKLWMIAAIALVTASVRADDVQKTQYLSKGVNALGQKLLREIEKKEGDKNLFISSYSVHEAISMAYSGSGGETRQELAKLLGLDAKQTNAQLAKDWKLFREQILDADPKVKLEIANSMWANKGQNVRFKKDFLSQNRTAHEAELRDEYDFSDEEPFLKEINGWVSKKTHGKIPKILSGPIREDQLFYLVNAIYFKGVWTKEFKKDETIDGKFTRLNGKQADVKLMVQGGRFPYYQDRQLEAVKLPFGKERRFGLAIYMPRANTAKAFFKSLKSEDLDRVNKGFRNSQGTVRIPRFKIEYGNEEVVEILKSLGVQWAFSDDADFFGIAENEASKINKIIHKAVVEVNEEGAEAAAATVVGGVRATSVQIDVPFEFTADHPFYFEIQDNLTGVVLFSGNLKDPK